MDENWGQHVRESGASPCSTPVQGAAAPRGGVTWTGWRTGPEVVPLRRTGWSGDPDTGHARPLRIRGNGPRQVEREEEDGPHGPRSSLVVCWAINWKEQPGWWF